MPVKRIYTEKKENYQVEAKALLEDLRSNLGIKGLSSVRIVNRYDVQGISEEEYLQARDIIFSNPPVDLYYEETLPTKTGQLMFAMEYLPGQYDQRADSAAKGIQLLTLGEKPIVKTARLILLDGEISPAELDKIKNYCINPVESREASLEKPDTLDAGYEAAKDIELVNGFINMTDDGLAAYWRDTGFAMTLADLRFCRKYFRDTEKRDPTITELKVIDTYWSDHCRHTTFLTGIRQAEFKQGPYIGKIESAYRRYQKSDRKYIQTNQRMRSDGHCHYYNEENEKTGSSMIWTNQMRLMPSIGVKVDVDGELQDWLLMFKNETHNHPTEIEPSAVQQPAGRRYTDPLSGRSYVYQAMRHRER